MAGVPVQIHGANEWLDNAVQFSDIVGMDAPREVIALYRVSTKGQSRGDKTGIERQQADIQFHCERFNLNVVHTFGFDGISGAVVQNTPQFREMLDRLREPQIAGVVFSQLDRFLRPEDVDAYGSFKIFRVAKKLLFCDASRPLDITNPEDRTVIITQLENAAMERRKIKYRTHRAKEKLIADPEISITKLPQGVRHVKDVKKYGPGTKKGYFEYTPHAHEKIAPAFRRVAAGETIRSVAKDLGFASETSLRIVLQNRWWIGINERVHRRIMSYDEDGQRIFSKRIKHENEIRHHTNLCEKPLIPVELFNRVQDLLAVHHKHWTQARSNANEFVGTGFLHCQCGCKMYLKYDARKGKPPVYVCSSYRTTEGPCGAPRMRAEDTDGEIVIAALAHFTDPPFLMHAMEEAMKSTEATQRRNDVESAQKAVEGLERRKRAIQRMVAMDEDEDAIAMYTKVKQELAEAKIRLATAQAQASPFEGDEVSTVAFAIADRFARFNTLCTAEQRSILEEVVERITIDENGLATFVVRGGLPIQRRKTVAEFFDNLLAIKDGKVDAKIQSLSL